MADGGGEGGGSAVAATAHPPEQQRSPRANSRGKRRSGRKEESYIRKKRSSKPLSRRPNDIYVNRKSDFASQLARSHKLLDQGVQELFIHGLGAAIHRAINLALQLKETSTHSLEMLCTTSTVELVDDLEPLDDESDFKTQTRPSSAIHIRLYKTLPPAMPTSIQATPTNSSGGSGPPPATTGTGGPSTTGAKRPSTTTKT